MINNIKPADLLTALDSASLVIKSLSASGVTVKTVTLSGAKPVIRVEPCGYCDGLIERGQAVFLEFGCGVVGRYRQGQFYRDGCKIVWSESLH